MNPLLLLLGLFGFGAIGSGGRSDTTTSSGNVPDPVVVDDDTDDDDSTDDNDTGGDDGNDGGDGNTGGGDTTPATATITLVVYDENGNIAATVANGDSIDFGDTDVSGYKIGAEIDGEGFNSVVFTLDGETYNQNIAPYDINSSDIDLTDGNFEITVTVHSEFNGEGDVIASETISFDTSASNSDDSGDDTGDDTGDGGTDDGDNDGGTDGDDTGGGDTGGDDGNDDTDDDDTTPATATITLVVYDENGNIAATVANGDSIDFGDTDVSGYKIGAEIDGEGFNSVVFTLDSETYNQNIAPYDINSSDIDLTDGNFEITVTVHSEFNGEGDVIASETISFDTSASNSDDSGDDTGDDTGDGGTDDGDNDGGTDGGDDTGGGDTGGDDGNTGDDTDDGDIGTPTPDGTPVILMLGQSNAEIMFNYSSMQDALGELGSEAMVVQVAGGGQSLSGANAPWNVVKGDGSDAPGSSYVELLQAIDAIRATTPDAYIAGAVWLQGEADAVSDNVIGNYYEPLTTLFTEMRTDIGEDFPITIVGLSDYQNLHVAAREHIQSVQEQAAADLSNVHFINTDEVIAENGLSESEVMRDGLHYTPEFFEQLADEVLDQPAQLTALGFNTGGGTDDGDGDGGHGDGHGDGGDDGGHGDGGDGSDGGDGGHGDGGHGDGGDDGGHGDGGHGDGHDIDHGTPDIPPPGVGASQSEINTFLNALANAPEGHPHGHDSSMADEHMAALDLTPRGDATHVAIGDGAWDDPNIWANGQVPGDNAKVLIPDGVTVTYDTISDARLFTVRIDGALDFATDTDSQMIFDTMVVSPTGHLIIGTEGNPVDPGVNVDLIIANNGPIDTNWDPMLLSRGIIAHGETKIHGAEKDSHDKVSDDPMAGDTSVKMAGGVPTGWQVGDTIVIAGTHYDGYTWGSSSQDNLTAQPNEDEVRTITKIDSDGRIWFDEALVHDHDSPRADLKTSVANYTRNVSIETENAEDAEVYERGHVMFMHSDDVDVRYAEFHELGRTDKSEDSVKVGDNMSFDTNVQGRYSVHLHRTGVDDIDNPAILEGNAVFGSPGWGFVHHDSHADLSNNASFDTFGAGFVAETGNETGSWDDNIAIYARGSVWAIPKNSSHVDKTTFDIAKGGEGFWFQGRMVASTDNVAASVNTGFAYFHRDGDSTMISIDADQFTYPAALNYIESNWADHAPILEFSGNETFAAREGLHVVKNNQNQFHDVHSHLDDFTAWSVVTGAHLQYTAHYILTDFDIVGREDGDFWRAEDGIKLENNTSDITIINARIDGFETGIDLHKQFTDGSTPKDLHSYTVIDANITNVDREFDSYDPRYDTVINSSDLPGHSPELDLDGGKLTWSGSNLSITGTKTDSLGEIPYPSGDDQYLIYGKSITGLVNNVGYWQTSSGETYTLVDFYFTDRATGEIYYETQPLYITVNLQTQSYVDAINHGVQNITTVNGVKMAGDIPLDVTMPAVPATTQSHAATTGDHTAHATMSAINPEEDHMESHAGATEDTTAQATMSAVHPDAMDTMEALSFEIGAGDLFVNTTDVTNIDLTATGGSTVLATGGSEFDLASGKTLAIFEAAANVGFDGDNEDEIAILDMHEDATVAFAAKDGDLGSIEEFASGAYGDEPKVQSGIDLGNATLSIDLTGLSAEAGTAFTLMNADEIVGLFEEAVVGGLGARNAKIVVDYENDSVSLQLSAGEGLVEVETQGQEADVTSGEEALWEALTAGHGLAEDHDDMNGLQDDDEDDMMHHAA